MTTTTTAKPKAAKLQRDCLCGCGTTTTGTFAPGHDNRFYGQVRRGERPSAELAPFPGLVRKLEGALKNDQRKAERKAAKAAGEPIEPEVNGDGDGVTMLADILAYANLTVTKVKQGRWQYPIRKLTHLYDGQYEVEFTDKKGNARVVRVGSDALA